MSNFLGFAAVGMALKQTIREFGYGPIVQDELKQTGEELVERFQEKIRAGGPGWPELHVDTVRKREKLGAGTADDPLYYTEQLLNSIGYKAKNKKLEIGVSGEHENPWGHQKISMPDLLFLHENGTSKMPPRPIFTDNDYPEIESEAVSNFEERVLASLDFIDYEGKD